MQIQTLFHSFLGAQGKFLFLAEYSPRWKGRFGSHLIQLQIPVFSILIFLQAIRIRKSHKIYMMLSHLPPFPTICRVMLFQFSVSTIEISLVSALYLLNILMVEVTCNLIFLISSFDIGMTVDFGYNILLHLFYLNFILLHLSNIK